ncbi:MAG: type I 3-dehydroquinate dehydratase [Lachnospiraceae bacterium]|nr:type I 3-dehydroquinate dehydratase [Lachnospiraceae bacterium]
MVSVNNINFGEGIPKIGASVTEEDQKSVIAAADIMVQKHVDFVEWRLDYFKQLENESVMNETLRRLNMSLEKLPLLLTYRSKAEGGKGTLPKEKIWELLKKYAASPYVDMIDVEVFAGFDFNESIDGYINDNVIDEETESFIADIKKSAVVVGSYHDFDGTPEIIKIEAALKVMDLLGCDILKIAVMPKSNADVLTLMSAVNEMSEMVTKKPIIAMSMGKLGSVSRLICESYGCAATFASVGQASAPGQIESAKLRGIIGTLHDIRK